MVKITALTNEATPVAADLVAIVDNVAVTPVTKKATLDNILAVYDAQTATMTNKTLTSPILTTPALGTPSAGTLTSCTGLPIVAGTTGTLSVARGGTGVTAKTGTGNVVLSTSPTLTTPLLGTPTSGTLTNCTGLPLAGILAAAKTEVIAIALGDESTVLAAASTTVPVVTYHMPYGFTLTNVKVGLTIAGTGAALATFDVHEAGTTVLSTKVTVDASEKTSGTAATQPVISAPALAVDSLIEIFVDLVDTDNLAAGAKVYLIGYQT